MPAPSASSAFTVARQVLSADLDLPSDAVLARLRAKGVKGQDKDLRLAINSVRKKLRKKAGPSAPKPVPVAARKTTAPFPSASAAVRAAMKANPGLAIDAVIQKVKAQGVTAPDASIRQAVHNVRSGLKKAAAKAAPAAFPPSATPAPAAVVVPAPAPPVGVSDVLSNVALVNAAVAAAGGVEQARKVADAVKACGGPDAFAQYLDLVAGIRTG